MKVLIVGSGGREHTIAWALKKSPQVEEIFVAPGNAGTASIGKNLDIGVNDFEKLAEFAQKEEIGLTIVGPEDPLVNGIVDFFEERELKAFGPSGKAAEIEGSKLFCRELLKKYNIPSAKFASFNNAEEAKVYLKEKGAPIAVKADGLAAGKGVTVAETIEEAEKAIDSTMVDKQFGEAGAKVLLEEKLQGEEASYLIFSDGKSILPMVSSQDHKRVFDNDKGRNTGGMGAYSPAPIVTDEIEARVLKEIMQPTVDAMREEGRLFKGVLYAGLMIGEQGPKIVEFNARFGDPETQVILPRLESDLVEIMLACIEERLAEQEIKWSEKAACCVAMASGGYPGAYEKGKEIRGLEEAGKLPETVVFHAGTRIEEGKILTNGGRVLGVTALGSSIREALGNSYKAVDIGQKALDREK